MRNLTYTREAWMAMPSLNETDEPLQPDMNKFGKKDAHKTKKDEYELYAQILKGNDSQSSYSINSGSASSGEKIARQ